MPSQLKLDHTDTDKPATPQDALRPPDALRQLTEAIAHLRYGSVEVVIHDARIVQIEVREKIRFNVVQAPGSSNHNAN